ncbi:MAG: DUF4838 domain-containing protein [Acidobacteriota bacterium]
MRLLLVLLAAATFSHAATGPLATRGKSVYSICVSAQASPSERRAAAELQSFLEKISGARLPVVTDDKAGRGPLILVGRSRELDRRRAGIDFAQLGPEGFALKTLGRDLAIAGGRERGTMYGVYAFLEKLGCRWFTPEVSRIPRLDDVPLPQLDETQKPSFEYREPYFSEAWDTDWAARNRQNGNFMRLDESAGGRMAYYPFVHSFYEMVPPEKYFAQHPEYFSLIDGERRVGRGQLCLTNPDVLRVSVDSVEKWIETHPEAGIFSVSQNDWTGWCECDRCRRVEEEEGGAHSGPVLRFVNALAAEIEKKHPGKLIDTLAYWYTEDPPAQARPRPNVRIRLCPIGVCEAHPYESCPRSAYFMRNLEAWSKITNQLYIWHYNTNFAHYLSPFPDFEELAADLPMYHRRGVVGVFLEGAYPPGGGGEMSELRAYVSARLLWDVKANANHAVDEFLQGVYGKAAPALREYYDLLHRQVREQHLYIFAPPGRIYSAAFVSEAEGLLDTAERAAEDDATRRRVRKVRLSLDYLKLERAKTFDVRDGVYAPAGLDAVKRQFAEFVGALRGFGIQSIREGVKLDKDEADFERHVRAWPVRTLESDRLRVDVAPGVGGRVVRLVLKSRGADLLFHTSAASPGYPDHGGLVLRAWPEAHAREPYAVEWTAAEGTEGELTLAGRAENGLRLKRTLRLAENVLSTRTEAVNEGAAPLDVQLQASTGIDPGMMDTPDVTVEFLSQARQEVKRTLWPAGEQPEGGEVFQSTAMPAGAWSIVNRRNGLVVKNSFDPAQAARCALHWSQRGESEVTQDVWSHPRRLAPGEKLELQLDLMVEPLR